MNNSAHHSFHCRCVSDILNGLSTGLSHFSGASRAAVIFTVEKSDPLIICDPQSLLKGHEQAFKALYLNSDKWLQNVSVPQDKKQFADIQTVEDLGLAGLISYGGYSGSVFFQRWFTEHHPDLCSTGPTERWLEHAVLRFSHDIANEKDLYTGVSGSFLKEYGYHAVRDHIVDEMNVSLGWDSHIRVYPMLDAILKLSKTREEGLWPEGQLLIVDSSMLNELNFLVRFEEEMQPLLANTKRIRKLLQTVEDSSRRLVSDGQTILGICDATLPSFSICADFRGRRGFLKVNKRKVCSFTDGRFRSTTHQAKLFQLEELLLELKLEQSVSFSIFSIAVNLVHHAQQRKHGCTLVIDLNPVPVHISGQTLCPALDLRQPQMLELAKSLAKVDGALHVGADLHLHGFACLLDGHAFSGEDLARGARYNSALRFTKEHEDVVVVVVSADRPVSVIYQGMEVYGTCSWNNVEDCIFPLERLEHWVGV
jgi:hypothetical protein